MSDDSSNHVLDEYLDASNNMRHYGNMRFAVLTLFSALSAGIVTVLANNSLPTDSEFPIQIKIAAFLISIILLIMEIRATEFFDIYTARAKELEKRLGFKQHSAREDTGIGGIKLLSAGYATRALYFAAIIYWLIEIINGIK